MTQFLSPDRNFAVTLQPEALRTILQEAKRAQPRETGGILVGRYTEWRDRAIVSEATAPPSDSVHKPTLFLRGIAGLDPLLRRRWRKGLHYLGDWHFHPFASADPSPQDLAQMKAFARDPQYKCPRPVLIVLGGDPKSTWTMAVRVLGGTVPIRLLRSD